MPAEKRSSATSQRLAAARRVVASALAVCVLLSAGGCTWSLGGSGAQNGRSGSQSSKGGLSVPIAPIAVPPDFAGAVAPPTTRGAYIGVFQPPAPFNMTALDAYASYSDKPPAIVMWYQPWAANGPRQFDPASCVSVYQHGAVPMITWEPWDPGGNANYVRHPAEQTAFRLANIIEGRYDDYIKQFADDVKSVRGPVMIRLMHEMNGNWYPWDGTVNGNTPAQFVAAWRHVHNIFAEEGATNVTWVWSVNHESVPATYENRYAAYYPGDAYVDWVAMSGFNWGTSSPYSSWRTFDHWYHAPLAYLDTLHKPIVIAEFASVENGGDKAAWITDAYTRIRTQHPKVRAVIYYDNREKGPGSTQDWRINSSAASILSFRAAVANPYYIPGPTTTLASWTASLTAENWLYLRSLKAVY